MAVISMGVQILWPMAMSPHHSYPGWIATVIPLSLFFIFLILAIGSIFWEYKQKFKYLQKAGTAGTATVLDIQDANATLNNDPQVKIQFLISSPGKPDFELKMKMFVPRVAIPRKGDVLPILYDPKNPQNLVVTAF